MTREEAIFCEKSYIGETNCTDCKYYGTDTCKSRESHRMAIKALEQEPTIKALGEELRKARKGIADEKVLIGYNLAVAICNKHLGESEDKE